MSPWHVINRDTGERVVTDLKIARRFLSRMFGLLLRNELPVGSGLLLVPCSSVHTFLMSFPIDVILLDRNGHVVDVRRNVRPWSLVRGKPGVHAVLEVPLGTTNVRIGQSLTLRAAPGYTQLPPKSAMFLWHGW